MTNFERSLILSVMGYQEKNLPLIFQMRKAKHFLAILEYCVKTEIVGESFYRMWEDKKFQWPLVLSYLLKKMNNDKFRPLSWADILPQDNKKVII